MIFMKLTVSHKAICCGDLSPRRVKATYRLVCPGLYDTVVNENATKPEYHWLNWRKNKRGARAARILANIFGSYQNEALENEERSTKHPKDRGVKWGWQAYTCTWSGFRCLCHNFTLLSTYLNERLF